jgi:hypothetical protein
MIRPYGSIGPLSFNFSDPYSFGSTAYLDPFKRIKNIRTYTEQNPLHGSDALEKALLEATMIIFLGFGYHATNLDLLRAERKSIPAVLGTVVGIHRENLDVIKSRIASNLGLTGIFVSLLDMKSAELLRDLRQKILISLE